MYRTSQVAHSGVKVAKDYEPLAFQVGSKFLSDNLNSNFAISQPHRSLRPPSNPTSFKGSPLSVR